MHLGGNSRVLVEHVTMECLQRNSGETVGTFLGDGGLTGRQAEDALLLREESLRERREAILYALFAAALGAIPGACCAVG